MQQPQNLLDFMAGPQQPDDGIVRRILTARFEPTAQDAGSAAMAGLAGDSYVSPQSYADQRVDRAVRQISAASQMRRSLSGGDPPSFQREATWFLSQPKEVQDQIMAYKRAPTTMNLGDRVAIYNPTDGVVRSSFPKGLPPQDAPELKRQQYQAEMDVKTGAEIDKQVQELSAFKESVSQFRDAIGKTDMMGPVAGRYGDLVADPGRTDLVSAQNALTLRAKTLLGMPSANFSDADRDFLTQIAGGKYGSKDGLGRVADRLEKLADDQISAYGARRPGGGAPPKPNPSAAINPFNVRYTAQKYGISEEQVIQMLQQNGVGGE
jgi:hypothetical protein